MTRQVLPPEIFVCPACGSSLGRLERCGNCNLGIEGPPGVYDFVLNGERSGERHHYDAEYRSPEHRSSPSMQDLEAIWMDPGRPIHAETLDALGDCQGKRILVLGNGDHVRELWFLSHDPALLIMTDLSVEAVRNVAHRAPPEQTERLVLAAMDALNLPLEDASVDVVYGMAFVHHLPDISQFLAEAFRVLRPGGRTVFQDDAYAPAWQRAKLTWLRPLMKFSHKTLPRSPEDLRHTVEGGFREQDLSNLIEGIGGQPFFQRRDLLVYFWQRAADVVLPLPDSLRRRLRNSRFIVPRLAAIDAWLARFRLVRQNQINMIWGFTKPGEPSDEVSAGS